MKKASHHPILFEDQWLILINKPSGALSHPNPNEPSNARCAFEGSYNRDERRFSTPLGPIWLIHRLDQETSGVLLAAKSKEISLECRQLFEDGKVKKIYQALMAGRLVPPVGIWRDCIEKRQLEGMVRSSVLPGKAPNAELHYKVRPSTGILPQILPEAVTARKLSFVEVELITGRTHQIRIQGASRKNPIAGDRIYGDFELNRHLRQFLGLKRLFLHAARLEFSHPMGGGSLKIESPLPKELQLVRVC